MAMHMFYYELIYRCIHLLLCDVVKFFNLLKCCQIIVVTVLFDTSVLEDGDAIIMPVSRFYDSYTDNGITELRLVK